MDVLFIFCPCTYSKRSFFYCYKPEHNPTKVVLTVYQKIVNMGKNTFAKAKKTSQQSVHQGKTNSRPDHIFSNVNTLGDAIKNGAAGVLLKHKKHRIVPYTGVLRIEK